MNLGAFMDPEYPIFSTTLCYLERDDAYLMLHRIKKQDDYNHDKWVGVGGKFERFESPEDCLVREVREETGLTLTRWRCRGLLTFVWGNMTEFIHLYTADGWQGEMVQGDACKEGVLEWVPKEKVTELPIWEGDKIFFRLLNGDRPYFSLKLVYDGDTLKQAVLDGRTDRRKDLTGSMSGSFPTQVNRAIPSPALLPSGNRVPPQRTLALGNSLPYCLQSWHKAKKPETH